jgi:DNA-binding transcriptional ArsR family regulator
LALRVRSRGQYDQRNRDYTTGAPDNEFVNRLYELSLRYGTEESAAELEAVFKMLGNRTRLRMIYALTRAGEMCVTDLAAALEMKPQAVSNQLQRLTDRGILASKRTGIHIYYRVVDTSVVKLLDRGIYLKEV